MHVYTHTRLCTIYTYIFIYIHITTYSHMTVSISREIRTFMYLSVYIYTHIYINVHINAFCDSCSTSDCCSMRKRASPGHMSRASPQQRPKTATNPMSGGSRKFAGRLWHLGLADFRGLQTLLLLLLLFRDLVASAALLEVVGCVVPELGVCFDLWEGS